MIAFAAGVTVGLVVGLLVGARVAFNYCTKQVSELRGRVRSLQELVDEWKGKQ